MIGNDIIDLALARTESNWKRPGWLEKLFVPAEIKYIVCSENPEVAIWQLWSRKEAVYKAYNRETGMRGFIPLQIVCGGLHNWEETACKEVILNGSTYYTKTITNRLFVHSIAARSIPIIHNLLLVYSRLKGFKVSKDCNGLPYFQDPSTGLIQAVSVSHHGRFYSKIIVSQ